MTRSSGVMGRAVMALKSREEQLGGAERARRRRLGVRLELKPKYVKVAEAIKDGQIIHSGGQQ